MTKPKAKQPTAVLEDNATHVMPRAVTRHTLDDFNFAETYLEYVTRQGSPDSSARAKILLATIAMLDLKYPDWRGSLLDVLASRGIERDIKDLLPLPHIDEQKLFADFMAAMVKGG